MKKMRMIAVMVLLGMMLSLAGCGGSDGTNALAVILSNFRVVVKDIDGNEIAKINSTNGMTCDASLMDTNLKKENSVKGRVIVKLPEKLKAGDQVVLTYVPDHEYSEYSMSWQYTCTK